MVSEYGKNISSSQTSQLGFAAFFFVFEVTRQVALRAKAISQRFESTNNSESSHVPRIVHAMTLVVGGVRYAYSQWRPNRD